MRQFNFPLRQPLSRWLRHRRQREELVMRGDPDNVGTAAIFATWGPRDASQRSVCEPRRAEVLGATAIVPKHAHSLAVVARPHWRGGADDPFLRWQVQCLRRRIPKLDLGCQEIIGA